MDFTWQHMALKSVSRTRPQVLGRERFLPRIVKVLGTISVPEIEIEKCYKKSWGLFSVQQFTCY